MSIGYVYAVGAAVAWGLLYAIDQKILHDTTPIGLTFATSVVTILVTVPYMLSHGGIRLAMGGDKMNLPLIIASAVLMTVSGILVLAGIRELNAVYVSFIEIAYPLFVVLFSYLMYRTLPNGYVALGGLLIMAGTVVIMTKGSAG